MDQSATFRSWLSLGLAHFFVDFLCTGALTLLSKGSAGTAVLWAILYNGLAFAFQLPLGALADCLHLTRRISAIGCFLVGAGALFSSPLPACILLGLGNACFHVGGGREALKCGGEKAGQVGRFVAPGALGIFLGPLCAARLPQFSFFAPVALLFCGGMLLFFSRRDEKLEALSLTKPSLPKGTLCLIVLFMFLTVLLRSYMGTVIHYDFQKKSLWAALFVLCIFLGKFFGGSLADRFGLLPFAALSQLLSTALFSLSLLLPVCAFPAIFLFNTSMAITACALYRCFPERGGTMFGLTTFALYLGAVPRLLGWESGLFTWWGLLLLGLCSAVSLLLGLWLMRKERCHVR